MSGSASFQACAIWASMSLTDGSARAAVPGIITNVRAATVLAARDAQRRCHGRSARSGPCTRGDTTRIQLLLLTPPTGFVQGSATVAAGPAWGLAGRCPTAD